jgi:DNA-binding beta-propeller fold protein YncE
MSRSHPLRGLALLVGTALVLTTFAFQSVAATNPGIALGDAGPLTKAKLASGSDPGVLPGSILIADEGNNRIVVVDPQGRVRWIFPQKGDLKAGQVFRSPDDVFFSPDGRFIISTQSENQMVSIIDIATRRIVFQYGHSGHESSKKGYLANPDDAIMVKDGRLLIADIKNRRLLFLDPKTRVTTKLGTNGRCFHHPPKSFGSPNGAFPMKDGRYLITEINGDWVDAMSLDGTISWSTHAPSVVYPSDTSEVKPNVYLTVDFSKPGQIVEFNSKGKLLWRYRPTGKGALDHTSLGHALPNGDVIATDDRNHRVIVVDPKTNKIVWQYGKYRIKGTGAGYLNNPDGLDVLPPNSLLNGN